MTLESETMETSQLPSPYLETLQVTSSTTSSIHISWEVGKDTSVNVEGFRVHYQKVASTYIQYGPLLSSSVGQYDIKNLVADTYYKVCLMVYRNDTDPVLDCVDASTTNWHIPVSIGSSIGAILALSMIVLIVLVSRCPSVVKWRGKQYKQTQKYDSMSSHYHDDHYEFSETMTHGHEEDMMSDQAEAYAVYEVVGHWRPEIRTQEKMCNGNHNHGNHNHISQSKLAQHNYMGARPKVYIPAHYPHQQCTHHHGGHEQGHIHSHPHHMDHEHSIDHGQQEDLNHNHHNASIVTHNNGQTQVQTLDEQCDHVDKRPTQTSYIPHNHVAMETGPQFSATDYEMKEIHHKGVVEEDTANDSSQGPQLEEHAL